VRLSGGGQGGPLPHPEQQWGGKEVSGVIGLKGSFRLIIGYSRRPATTTSHPPERARSSPDFSEEGVELAPPDLFRELRWFGKAANPCQCREEARAMAQACC